MKVLVVEDDSDLAALLAATLSKHNCVIDIATDGEMGLAMVAEWEYDVIVLDVLLPKLDGIAVCRQLRDRHCTTPILMLTAQATTTAVVTGLDAGADDYVTKPFDPQQVLARLRALQRRPTPAITTNALHWGELVLDTVLRQVTYAQQDISLSPKEYAILELFLRNPKRIFSRSGIIDKLWSIDEVPSEPTVTNLIKDLRRKLKAAGVPYDPVETLHGSGYRLKPLPEEPLPPVPADPPQAEPTQAETGPTLEQVSAQFQANLTERLAVLETAQAALGQGQLTAEHQAEALALAHRLTGSLGTFGYGQGSDTMRAIEHLLSEPFPLQPEQAQRLAALLETLHQRLNQPPSFEPIALASPGTAQIFMVGAGQRSEPKFGQALAIAAADLGVTLTPLPDRATAYHRLAEQVPDAIVVALGPTAPAETLAFLADLNTDFPTLPIVVLADQDSLEARRAVTPYRVQRFVSQPIQATALLAMVTQVLAEVPISPATALIVDSDPIALQGLSGLLLTQGIQTTCLLHPSQFWTLLKAVNPDLLLLAAAMPGYDGLELCKIVRQDAIYRDLPILVMAPPNDADLMQQAFAAGADEVFAKPVPEAMLRTRLDQYLRRRHRITPSP